MMKLQLENTSIEKQIISLIEKDLLRINILEVVSQLNLPQGYVAAGFVRNLVWDALHQKVESTALNDVDVIYFNPDNLDPNQDAEYEGQLNALMPNVNWQVRNQARMHLRNQDLPYISCVDAMSHWPEKETAVAVRKQGNTYVFISAFNLALLFEGKISHNPKRDLASFKQRVEQKHWQEIWPELVVSL